MKTAMKQTSLRFAFVVLCIACRVEDISFGKDALPEPPTKLDVRLVDVDGKPVEGAHVGAFCCFFPESRAALIPKSNDSKPDECNWRYYPPNVISDKEGRAHIDYMYGISGIVARHVGRRLVAIEKIAPEQSKGTVTVSMRPPCLVHGRLVSKELEARGRQIHWSNVYLFLNDGRGRLMACESLEREFHFYVVPGEYKLEAYGEMTHSVMKSITVKAGQADVVVDPIDLPPTRLALLEGQPAPELQDIAGWKNSGPIRLSDLRGKVVLLDFWGYWCNPCVGSMPELFSVYDKFRDQGLVVIGVHVAVGDKIDTAAKLDEKLTGIKKRLWKDRDIPFPVALAVEHRVPHRPDIEAKATCPAAAAYGITGYPTCVLIDRQGRVVGNFYASDKTAMATLEKALREKPPAR